MFQPPRDATEARLTIDRLHRARNRFFLAVQDRFKLCKIIRTLRPLQFVTITLAGRQITSTPDLIDDAQHHLNALTL